MSDKILNGERLKLARREKQLTQEALAEILGMVRSNISHYENGKVSVSSEMLFKLAKVLNVTPDWLMEGDSNDSPQGEFVNNKITNGNSNQIGNIHGEVSPAGKAMMYVVEVDYLKRELEGKDELIKELRERIVDLKETIAELKEKAK